jgi:hypothetical protein
MRFRRATWAHYRLNWISRVMISTSLSTSGIDPDAMRFDDLLGGDEHRQATGGAPPSTRYFASAAAITRLACSAIAARYPRSSAQTSVLSNRARNRTIPRSTPAQNPPVNLTTAASRHRPIDALAVAAAGISPCHRVPYGSQAEQKPAASASTQTSHSTEAPCSPPEPGTAQR